MADRIRTITIADFRAEIEAQGADSYMQAAFICPMCGTVQDRQDWMDAGATAERVTAVLGFSCVGRQTGAPSPRKAPDGKPCNWTLGGLFRTHRLEVVDDQGKAHPNFEVATREQAQAHREAREARRTRWLGPAPGAPR